MNTIIIGASGFIGRQLLSEYTAYNIETIGTSYKNKDKGLVQFDLKSKDYNSLSFGRNRVDSVIITSSISNIDYCEKNEREAHETNVAGTINLIKYFSKNRTKIIFLSTDYVFSGELGQYSNTSAPAPSTVYGKQKLHVEKAISEICNEYLIVRLSKIYGLKKNDGTILDSIAKEIVNMREVKLANDQIFSPTYVGDLVSTIRDLDLANITGIVHVCSQEAVSRYEIGISVCKALNGHKELIQRCSLRDLALSGNRPLNTSMKCTMSNVTENKRFMCLSEAIDIVAKNWLGPSEL